MKKLLLAAVLFASSVAAFGQGFAIPIANDTTTGTVAKKPCRLVATGSTPSVVLSNSVSDLQVIGICGDGAGTTGNVMVQVFGIVSKKCTFDNATTYGHYVQVGTGGCHDAGASKPTSGAILGTVFDVGGAAGDYVISLNKDIYPSASSTAPLCSLIGSSDTLSQTVSAGVGTFATTCSVPSTAISGVGQFIEVIAHGTYTTSNTASPILNLQVNGGGTSPVCSFGTNAGTGLSITSVWDLHCYIHIVTTGAPGTADTWGAIQIGANAGGTATVFRNWTQTATVSFTTNSSQNITIGQAATMVAGESASLTDLIVRAY